MRKNFAFFLYLILALILIVGGNEARYKKAAFLSKTAFFPFSNSIEKIQSLLDIREKNKLLTEELAYKTQKIVNLESLLESCENVILQFETEDYDFVIAAVVGFTGVFQERNLIIDKGIKDKISINSPVISNVGIAGKVISISMNYSVVLPLNHSDFKLGVMSKRTHLQGIMESDAFGNSFVNLVRLGSDIAVGDTIITSNLSGIFPKGYPVGVITRLREAPDQVYMYANLQTFVNPACLDQVIVLNYQKEREYETEISRNRSE